MPRFPLRMRLAAALALGLPAGPSLAQSTVGALLDAGAKALTGTELRALISESTVRGRNDQNARLTTVMKADGSFSGEGISSTGHDFVYGGQWRINDTDQVCYDMLTQFGQGRFCERFYRLGERYFLASDPEGRIERTHPVFERSIRRGLPVDRTNTRKFPNDRK